MKRERETVLEDPLDADEQERIRNRATHNENQKRLNTLDRHKDPSHGKAKTMKMVIDTFIRVLMGPELDVSQGDPREVPLDVQVKHWKDQKARNIRPSHRSCMVHMPNGAVVESPIHIYITKRGSTKAQKVLRKEAGNTKRGSTMLGCEQQHALEGAAILMLRKLLQLLCPEEFACWTLKPVFDGNQADMMARHESWAFDQWMAIQIKSCRIKLGTHATYGLRHGQYDGNINCVAVGIRNFKADKEPKSADDTEAKGYVYELWNVGDSKNVKASLQPTPDVKYRPLGADRRMETKSSVEKQTEFLRNMLAEWRAWQNKLNKSDILYDMAVFNAKSTEKTKTEKRGFETIANALGALSVKLSPVWRQNECVDFKLVLDNRELYVSGKTGSVVNNNVHQRYFLLNVAPNKHFCDVVVASYAKNHQRVAVMAPSDVYIAGSFCWNEKDLKKGVAIFDLDTEAEEFLKHVFSFARN